MSQDYDKVYEVEKDIKVNSVMQLIDLNGSKTNFQSDCLITNVDPSKKVLVAIVNQDELDIGNINFEPIEDNGKYARRITFQENVKKNHFICIKKHNSEEQDEIDCHIIIRMKEIPPKIEQPVKKQAPEQIHKQTPKQIPNVPEKVPKQVSNVPKQVSNVPKQVTEKVPKQVSDENTRLKKELEELRKQKEYILKKELEEEKERLIENKVQNIQNTQKNSPRNHLNYMDLISQDTDANPYYKISMICLAVFAVIIFYKFMRNK
jgi:hypothetical protein